ncbi:probable cyclic nucleotide-gated ion channel 20, chloroplastic isoform X2 [Impatiens glandulifera]|uniref:probable cyclic nucleotide-gated ion channel 20, chloroplastic isoform X2 n=1 Tax=Impatiens glandulifera TaxID=253017 RepID=UPI001FB0E981|nr:probable cyclic nucleotide-gated ion channel 20, chloroplastic isoform X2 [Impatiens glandulifera]
MASLEGDKVPMLSNEMDSLTIELQESNRRRFSSRTRSASMSINVNTTQPHENQGNFVSHSGPLGNVTKTAFTPTSGLFKIFTPTTSVVNSKKEHLLKSGQLGVCNDPYCTTCPTYSSNKTQEQSRPLIMYDSKFYNILYGDSEGRAQGILTSLRKFIPVVMNPHTKHVKQWNKFFACSCLFAVFLDPLFFFLLSVHEKNKCIVISWTGTMAIVILRSITDFIYFLHILLQFRLAYVAPESRVFGAGDLVDDPKEIALNYLRGYFLVDFFVVLPLPQIIVLTVLPKLLGVSGANYSKNLLRTAILLQYIPRLFRFLPLVAGQSPVGFIFESAWGNFVINLLTFVLAGHVVGSCWYLLGLQRVNQCLRDACYVSGTNDCKVFIDCGYVENIERLPNPARQNWTVNTNATACFDQDGYPYGIYVQAVNLTTEKHSVLTRYIYSLFWGFQQISTLAGNQVPSYYEWEVLFTMAIVALGLLLFALLIGNMQNFLQSLGRRRLEMSLRRRDVEQWMSHRRLPHELRRHVREAERYNWAATRGVNEEMVLENLPEDLQRKIRRHLFKFVKKVHIFTLMDEPVLDAICERLRQRTYIKESKILYSGGLIDKMVFIVRGKMESYQGDGIKSSLSEGSVCGEELLSWCLEHSSTSKDGRKGSSRIPSQKLLSNRDVKCVTNVEAFILRAADLEEVTSLFARFLRNPRVQGAIRYSSPYWRGLAASRIQVAWRYWNRRYNQKPCR